MQDEASVTRTYALVVFLLMIIAVLAYVGIAVSA